MAVILSLGRACAREPTLPCCSVSIPWTAYGVARGGERVIALCAMCFGKSGWRAANQNDQPSVMKYSISFFLIPSPGSES